MTSLTPLFKNNPDFLGQVLIKRGFKDWFLYMFRVLEGRPFIQEPIHEDLFTLIQNIYDLKHNRVIINVPPRSAKTTLAKYLLIYSLTLNPKSQFIYTSYSQLLLNDIARDVMNILENPIYKAMYPMRVQMKEESTDPIDDFWREYLKEITGKNKYSSNRIITALGGQVLFSSMGASITGFGVSIRGAKGFTGALIIDDGQKPIDIRSSLMREKVYRYYEETLLSRLNNSDAPIINIQQRLHQDDLSGFLKEKYGFYTLCKPLVVDGVCQIPSQYTEQRLEEIQKNNFLFQSQYQQEPVAEGGNLIKTEWFNRYNVPLQYYKQLYIVCDTAFSEKSSADNTVFSAFGVDESNHIWLLDLYCKKVIFPDMKRDLISFYQKFKANYGAYSPFGSIYIENKGSGISLIQQLRSEGLPIRELTPTITVKGKAGGSKERITDKYTRFLEISADLESGYVHIPESSPWILDFINECEAFTGGKQNEHDDMVEAGVIYPLKVRREFEQPNWEAVSRAFR